MSDKKETENVKLKDLLQWEIPELSTRYGEPSAWILRSKAAAYKGKDFAYKFAVNRVWFKENEPELYKRSASTNKKSVDIGISISIDRPNKIMYVAFDPPAEVLQWTAKYNQDSSGTVIIMNKRLGEDIFETFGIPSVKYGTLKQFFNTELSKKYGVVEGRKVYEFTYSQGSLQNVTERQKQMKEIEKTK